MMLAKLGARSCVALSFAALAACVGPVPGTSVGDPDPDPDAGGTAGTPDAGSVDPTRDAAPPGTPDARPPAPGDPDAQPPPGPPDAGPPGTGPGSDVDWIDFAPLNSRSDSGWGPVLTEIARHCPPSQVDYYMVPGDLVASGHELSHGIHAYVRNELGGPGQNGFFVLDDKAAVVDEPGIRKSDVVPYIPSRYHGSRYELYILGQVEWDDTPLYVWDEWNAYINGTEVGVNLAETGAWTDGSVDVCMGPLEFVVYALAVGMATEALDPSYFATNTQFKEFLAWNTARAMDVVRECLALDDFGSWPSIDQYYSDLRTHADGAPIREFLRRTYGDAFTNEVLDL